MTKHDLRELKIQAFEKAIPVHGYLAVQAILCGSELNEYYEECSIIVEAVKRFKSKLTNVSDDEFPDRMEFDEIFNEIEERSKTGGYSILVHRQQMTEIFKKVSECYLESL